MITQDLEGLKGKKVKDKGGKEHLVLGSYVTESAGLVLVTASTNSTGAPIMDTLRAVGTQLEIVG